MQQPLTESMYYILLALKEPRHGYHIMQLVSEMSHDRMQLGAGTTYGALKTLQQKGWITALDGDGRQKNYIITAQGITVVQHEIQRLHELYTNGTTIFPAKEYER